jgi:adenosylcobinamide kinase/adenosylcobinamide-phosphate guanylyltransferase
MHTLRFGSPATYIATCEVLDKEMAQRVKKHQARRGENWSTLFTPFNLADEIKKVGSNGPILVDCLTLWLSNHLLKNNALEKEIDELTSSLKNSKSNIVLVSNEVGTGIVPDNALARKFRDSAGLMNQKIASVSDEVYWVVAGIQTQIK